MNNLVTVIYGGLLLSISVPITIGAVLAFGFTEEKPWSGLAFMIAHTVASIGILMKFVPAFVLHAALLLTLAVYVLMPFESRHAMAWIAFVFLCVGIALFDVWQIAQLMLQRKS